MKLHEPSRTLNAAKLDLMGLGFNDFIGLVSFYGISQAITYGVFDITPVISLFLTILFGGALIYIRQKTRKHIIRDFVSYAFYKIIKLGVRYDKAK